MVVEDSGALVAVLGPADLLVTCLVDALRSTGFRATRFPCLPAGPELRQAEPGDPRVLIVDLDRPEAVQAVACAASAGWTVVAIGGERATAAAAVVAGAEEWIDRDAGFADLVEIVRAGVAGALRMSDDRRDEWHALHRRTRARSARRQSA